MQHVKRNERRTLSLSLPLPRQHVSERAEFVIVYYATNNFVFKAAPNCVFSPRGELCLELLQCFFTLLGVDCDNP